MSHHDGPREPRAKDGMDRRAFLHYGAAGGALAAAQAAGRALPLRGDDALAAAAPAAPGRPAPAARA
ncbi:MAG: hypothetical protein IRZ00_18595, partial [Gemmatimonadetes bacterium]|nr:hypothetical protein [Gemmatimonadota bacterium]